MEIYDEIKEEFSYTKQYKLSLQHSLVSIAKWEAKWKKPFLDGTKRTTEETLDYIKCMTITQNIPEIVYTRLPADIIETIRNHIADDMTATVITRDPNAPPSKEVYTAEVIYYWMVALDIPMECQTWHISRLLTLIQVCNIKNSPDKKMGRQETLSRQRRLNQERKAKMKTRG